MVCAHHHELRDKASASLRHRYLPMPSLTQKKRVAGKTRRSLELINEIGRKSNFKKYERVCASIPTPTKNGERHLKTWLPEQRKMSALVESHQPSQSRSCPRQAVGGGSNRHPQGNSAVNRTSGSDPATFPTCLRRKREGAPQKTNRSLPMSKRAPPARRTSPWWHRRWNESLEHPSGVRCLAQAQRGAGKAWDLELLRGYSC